MIEFLPAETTIELLSNRLNALLSSGQRVVWLTSGGSCIDIAIEVRKKLHLSPAHQLTVGLIDERYVALDDDNSNMKQLLDGGFDTSNLKFLRVLRQGFDLGNTAAAYNMELEKAFDDSQVSIGLFGIGNDGHTAGILPDSPLTESSGRLIDFYQGPDFQRISLTLAGIARLDEADVYSVGEPKWQQLKRLQQEISIREMPAQALKRFNPLRVYTDYKGETT